MAWRWIVLMLLPLGCHLVAPLSGVENSGESHPDARGDQGTADVALADALVVDTPSADILDLGAAPDTQTDPLSPFSPGQVVQELDTTAGEDDPTLTADMLEIYFVRGSDIWRAQRTDVSLPWSSPQKVSELNSSAADVNPEISADGLTIFVSSNRADARAQGDLDIFQATRTSRGAAWSTPQPVVELSSPDKESNAAPTADLTTVFLARAPAGGSYDIFSATRSTATATWSKPAPVPGLNSSTADYGPWINASATVVCFVSYRTGPVSGEALWIATRPDTASAFATPQPIPGLNGETGDEDPWLSPDLRTIYFAGKRGGSYAILVAQRP